MGPADAALKPALPASSPSMFPQAQERAVLSALHRPQLLYLHCGLAAAQRWPQKASEVPTGPAQVPLAQPETGFPHFPFSEAPQNRACDPRPLIDKSG